MTRGDTFDVDVRYYADDGTWTAVSDDIRGLAVEADSLPTLHRELDEVASDLLMHNASMSRAEVDASTLRLSITIMMHDPEIQIMVEDAWTRPTSGTYHTESSLPNRPHLLYKPRLAFGSLARA